MHETGKITRKAILLSYCVDEHEKFKSDLDFGLVKSFLKSASGGCFRDEEIEEYASVFFTRKSLFELLDCYDYMFVYFSGHSLFENRQVQIPLKNSEVIAESEFIRPNKKLWIFMDCCRTQREPMNSPDFELPRKEYLFPQSCPQRRENWVSKISQMEPFSLIYYVTKLGEFAFSNAIGGFGTQIFFTTLMEKLDSETTFDFGQLVREINQSPIAIQESSYIPGGLNLKEFSSLF